MPSHSDRQRVLTRRGALAAGAGTLAVALAGCTRASELLVDHFTGEVNIFNTSDERLTGSLELVDPDGATVLDEGLVLGPESGDGEREPAAVYEAVLTTPGGYQLTLHIDSTGRTDETHREERLQIRTPDEEQIVVFLGRELTGQFVTITVVEDFAELEDVIEDA